MSKSNIRNINNLGVFKEPVIIYSGDQYTDLIFLLKKKSIWSVSSNRNTYKNFKNRSGDYFLHMYYNINYNKDSYKLKPITFKTNPFSSTSFKSKEFFFWTKINYINDINK